MTRAAKLADLGLFRTKQSEDDPADLFCTHKDYRRFLQGISQPENCHEFSRCCNKTPVKSTDPQYAEHCDIQFSPGLNVQFEETTFARGGLGFRLFPAAVVLSDWLIRNESRLRGKRLLELGSGVGVPGILAAKLGAQRVVLSDFSPALLSGLARMAKRNCPREVASRRLAPRFLDWSQAAALAAATADYSGSDKERARNVRRCTRSLSESSYDGKTPALDSAQSPVNNHSPASASSLSSSTSGSSAESGALLHSLRSAESGEDAWLRGIGTERFDLIIAADVVYEEKFADWLPHVLVAHLMPLRSDTKPPVVSASGSASPAASAADCTSPLSSSLFATTVAPSSSSASAQPNNATVSKHQQPQQPQQQQQQQQDARSEEKTHLRAVIVTPTRVLSILNALVNNLAAVGFRVVATSCRGAAQRANARRGAAASSAPVSAPQSRALAHAPAAAESRPASGETASASSNVCVWDARESRFVLHTVEGEDCLILSCYQ